MSVTRRSALHRTADPPAAAPAGLPYRSVDRLREPVRHVPTAVLVAARRRPHPPRRAPEGRTDRSQRAVAVQDAPRCLRRESTWRAADLVVEVRSDVHAQIDGPMPLHGLQEMAGVQLIRPRASHGPTGPGAVRGALRGVPPSRIAARDRRTNRLPDPIRGVGVTGDEASLADARRRADRRGLAPVHDEAQPKRVDHLGLNLYSNIPAVLSEVVANAWDADAEEVEIVIDVDSRTISVADDGIGMTPKDLNDRFLYVGFERRKAGASVTARRRAVMGRKRIGKLSLFAIADTVQVESVKGGQRAEFRSSGRRTSALRWAKARGVTTRHRWMLHTLTWSGARGSLSPTSGCVPRKERGPRSAVGSLAGSA